MEKLEHRSTSIGAKRSTCVSLLERDVSSVLNFLNDWNVSFLDEIFIRNTFYYRSPPLEHFENSSSCAAPSVINLLSYFELIIYKITATTRYRVEHAIKMDIDSYNGTRAKDNLILCE